MKPGREVGSSVSSLLILLVCSAEPLPFANPPKRAPKIGANTSAYNKDPVRTKKTVVGISLIKEPIPPQNIKGVKATNVVAVDVRTGQNILLAAVV